MTRIVPAAGLALLLACLSAPELRAEGGWNFGFNVSYSCGCHSCGLLYASHPCSCCITNPFGFDPCKFGYGQCDTPPIYHSSPLNDWLAFGAGHPPAGVNLFPPPGYGLGWGYGTGEVYAAPPAGGQGYGSPPMPQAAPQGYGAYRMPQWGQGRAGYGGGYWPQGGMSTGYSGFMGGAGY